MKVKFFYSSKDQPGAQYPCDIQAAQAKIKQLKAAGIDAEAIDVAGMDDVFRAYHSALTGPPATVRAVFGMKGALEADFGRKTPALVVYTDPSSRYPTDAYPRQDAGRGGLVGVDRALDDLLAEQDKVPVG
ncbi:MAG TPA: hypothetical protein VGK54_14845, partial [Chloroflexota bacterium]